MEPTFEQSVEFFRALFRRLELQVPATYAYFAAGSLIAFVDDPARNIPKDDDKPAVGDTMTSEKFEEIMTNRRRPTTSLEQWMANLLDGDPELKIAVERRLSDIRGKS